MRDNKRYKKSQLGVENLVDWDMIYSTSQLIKLGKAKIVTNNGVKYTVLKK